jgi:hypothetical protein
MTGQSTEVAKKSRGRWRFTIGASVALVLGLVFLPALLDTIDNYGLDNEYVPVKMASDGGFLPFVYESDQNYWAQLSHTISVSF